MKRSTFTDDPSEMTPEHCMVEIASLLAAALLRMQKMRDEQLGDNFSVPSLEVPPQTVLSVTSGLLPETLERGDV